MKTTKAATTRFDAAEYLDSPKKIAVFLNDAFESGSDDEILQALATVARAKGMSAIAAEAGVSRPSLYKSLADGARPDFQTVSKILRAFGLSLSVHAA